MTDRILIYVRPGQESVSAAIHKIVRLVDTSVPSIVRVSSSIPEALSGRYLVIDTSTWGKTPPATGAVLEAFVRLNSEEATNHSTSSVTVAPQVEHLYNQGTALVDIWRIIGPYLKK